MSAVKENKWLNTKLVALTLTTTLLLGCASPTYPSKPEILIIMPDLALLRDCEQLAPPKTADYANKAWDEKERILVEDIRSRMTIIGGCDSRFKALRVWRQQQSALP